MTEEQSVSEQVDHILETYFEQFTSLVSKNQNDNAIAIGDEVREWMKDLETETILFYNERELRQQYKDLRKQNKQ
jgi:hypothetical protein